MFEPTTLVHKVCSLIIGVLIIVDLLLLGARGVASASSSSGTAVASGDPNVITGSIAATIHVADDTVDRAGNDFGQALRSVGHTISTTPRPVVRATSQGVRSIGEMTAHNAQFISDSVQKSTTFVGRSMVDSMAFAASAASKTTALVADTATMTALTKPADKTAAPVIEPQEATVLALQKVASQNTPVPSLAPAVIAAVVPTSPTLPIQQASTVKNTGLSESQAQANDLYAWGNCTWWVAIRRAQIGDPIPNSWGNATSWAQAARSDGYAVNHRPSPGAIMQLPYVDGGLGHVAFVESVDPDGTWHISEMNVLGLDVVDHKAEPPSAAAAYYFIHDKA